MANDRPDQANRSVESWERALRVRTTVVAQQLVELKAAANEVPDELRTVAELAPIDYVTSFVSTEIGRAYAMHLSRQRAGLDDDRALQLVVAAESAVDAIGHEPAVAAFLRRGACVEAPRFKNACRMMLALLDVQPQQGARAGGEPVAPTMRSESALLAALPPLVIEGSTKLVFDAARRDTRAVLNHMTLSDFAALERILREFPTHQVAIRFRKFAPDTQAALLAILKDGKTRARARAIEAQMPSLTPPTPPTPCDGFPVARGHATRLTSDDEQGCHADPM